MQKSDTHTDKIPGQDLADFLERLATHQDKQAFATLFSYFAPRVKAYMIKLGCAETLAEELAQQTLLQVWVKAHLFNREKAAASTWIFCIARNLRIDRIRKEKNYIYQDYDLSVFEDNSDGADKIIDRQQHDGYMREAIAELPEDQIEVIKLSFYEGLSHSEISERLDVALGTVKSRMRLAFKKLRSRMDEIL